MENSGLSAFADSSRYPFPFVERFKRFNNLMLIRGSLTNVKVAPRNRIRWSTAAENRCSIVNWFASRILVNSLALVYMVYPSIIKTTGLLKPLFEWYALNGKVGLLGLLWSSGILNHTYYVDWNRVSFSICFILSIMAIRDRTSFAVFGLCWQEIRMIMEIANTIGNTNLFAIIDVF